MGPPRSRRGMPRRQRCSGPAAPGCCCIMRLHVAALDVPLVALPLQRVVHRHGCDAAPPFGLETDLGIGFLFAERDGIDVDVHALHVDFLRDVFDHALLSPLPAYRCFSAAREQQGRAGKWIANFTFRLYRAPSRSSASTSPGIVNADASTATGMPCARSVALVTGPMLAMRIPSSASAPTASTADSAPWKNW